MFPPFSSSSSSKVLTGTRSRGRGRGGGTLRAAGGRGKVPGGTLEGGGVAQNGWRGDGAVMAGASGLYPSGWYGSTEAQHQTS